jgi:predicted MFS family arabinose efflux permease
MNGSAELGLETASPRPAAGRLAPLRYPAFRRLVAAKTASTVGSWMQLVAAGWLTYKLTGSAASVGVITIASRGPGVVVAAYGGVLADRGGARRLGICVAVVQTLAAALLAAVAAAGSIAVAEIYAATLVIGVGSAIAAPLIQNIVPQSVPPEMRSNANSINSTAYTTARMIGPLVGGGVVATFGVSWCFAINAASFLAVVALFLSLPRDAEQRSHDAVGVRAALHHARVIPMLTTILVTIGAFSAFVAPIQELAPVIAHERGGGAHIVGLLLGALAFGGVLGSLLVTRFVKDNRPRHYVLSVASGLSGAAVIALGFAPDIVTALLAMALAGLFWDVYFVAAQTAIPTVSPHELVGSETGLFYALTLAGLAIGAPLLGLLIDATSVRAALSISGGLMILVALWRAAGLRRRLRAGRVEARRLATTDVLG